MKFAIAMPLLSRRQCRGGVFFVLLMVPMRCGLRVFEVLLSIPLHSLQALSKYGSEEQILSGFMVPAWSLLEQGFSGDARWEWDATV